MIQVDPQRQVVGMITMIIFTRFNDLIEMPYDEKKKVLFVHIPKTAGTAVEEAMGVYGKYNCGHGPDGKGGYLQHKKLQEYNRHEFKDYFKFAFVRNPYERILSEFLYLKKKNDPFLQDMDFRAFVNWLLSEIIVWPLEPPRYIFDHILPQYFFTDSYWLDLDFIGKFEDLDSHWSDIAFRFGYPSQLKKLNTSSENQIDVASFYDEKTQDLVSEYYKLDFVEFGYNPLEIPTIKKIKK